MGPDATYLIWSHEHGAWWRPGGSGYTLRLSEAGQYSRFEALKICAAAALTWRDDQPFNELPVALDDAHELAVLARQVQGASGGQPA